MSGGVSKKALIEKSISEATVRAPKQGGTPVPAGTYADITQLQACAGNRATGEVLAGGLKVTAAGDESERAAEEIAAGRGRPLPDTEAEIREEEIERTFDVQIHHDDEAAEAAEALNAHAFTCGRDIFFNRGEFRTGAGVGRRLLRHELAHVAAQATRAAVPDTVFRAEKGGVPSPKKQLGPKERALQAILSGFKAIVRPESTKEGVTELEKAVSELGSAPGPDSLRLEVRKKLVSLIAILESPKEGLLRLSKEEVPIKDSNDVYNSMFAPGEALNRNPASLLQVLRRECVDYFGEAAVAMWDVVTEERLTIIHEMMERQAAPVKYPPNETDEERYFLQLAKLDNDHLLEAYRQYVSAFYKHSGRDVVFKDLKDMSVAKIRSAPTAATGHFQSDCEGLFRVSVRLLEIAGFTLEEVVVGAKKKDKSWIAHVIGRLARRGESIFVSNLKVFFSETDAFKCLGTGAGKDAIYMGYGKNEEEAADELKKRIEEAEATVKEKQ